jgi:hypothetical protein
MKSYLGGFVGKSEVGAPVLVFDRVHQRREFRLRWRYVDDLPDLPGPKASATLGCDFCAFLRAAIIRACAGQTDICMGDASLGLTYI